MARQRAKRRPPVWRRPRLTIEQILVWADAHHERTGQWPNQKSGFVLGTLGEEKWGRIDQALMYGQRGLPAGLSLAKLFEERRGVRNPQNLPPLTDEQILAWADAYHQR